MGTIKNIYTGEKYMLAEYARDHGLTDEWEGPRMKIRAAAKNSKTLLKMVKQAKLKSFRTTSCIRMDTKCLVIINKLWTYLDRINGNTKWADAEKLEKNQLFEYETFDDRGHTNLHPLPLMGTRRSATYILSTTSSMMANSKLVLLPVDI